MADGRRTSVGKRRADPGRKAGLTGASLLLVVLGFATPGVYGTLAGPLPPSNPVQYDAMEAPSPGRRTTSPVVRMLLLQDYNTRLVVIGTSLLGCAAGMIGSFALLRKRALMGDALSHATLPGICLAFILVTSWGGDGKSLPWLLLGATATGLLGVVAILAIRRGTRLKDDTAMGIVLSVFFGAGVALLRTAQTMGQGNAAGLESFVFGKTAAMTTGDALLIGGAAVVGIGAAILLFKELILVCFDDGFAGSQGMPVTWLDFVLMAMIVLVTIVGLQAVGLILMIALLVIPASAARFWTDAAGPLFLVSGLVGGVCGYGGSAISALYWKLPSGAMIVLVCAAFFAFSMVFGTRRGVLKRNWERWQAHWNIQREHLLRAVYEVVESVAPSSPGSEWVADRDFAGRGVPLDLLLAKRSWTRRQLMRAIRRAERAGLVDASSGEVYLHRSGLIEARRLTRQHRLWELYLIHYADVATSQVDRSADMIEHVLDPAVVDELEALLEKSLAEMPPSPHALPVGGAASERGLPTSTRGASRSDHSSAHTGGHEAGGGAHAG